MNVVYNKNKLYKTLDYLSRLLMLNFEFLEKCLEIVSLPHFVNDFSSENWGYLGQFPAPNLNNRKKNHPERISYIFSKKVLLTF